MKSLLLLSLLCLLPQFCFTHGPSDGHFVPVENADVNNLKDEMFDAYYDIFYRSFNRNAASHRWANWVFNRTHELTAPEFYEIFKYWCPVSGSPIGSPTRSYEVRLPIIEGDTVSATEEQTGAFFVCCSPCVCDTVDFIKVRPMEVELRGGVKETFDFLVLADPCPFVGDDKQIPGSAKDVHCTDLDGTLDEPILEDAVYIPNTKWYIIGMFYPPGEGSYINSYAEEQQLLFEGGACDWRAENGYPSGMGTIFRQVAEINPSNSEPSNTVLTDSINADVENSVGTSVTELVTEIATTNEILTTSSEILASSTEDPISTTPEIFVSTSSLDVETPTQIVVETTEKIQTSEILETSEATKISETASTTAEISETKVATSETSETTIETAEISTTESSESTQVFENTTEIFESTGKNTETTQSITSESTTEEATTTSESTTNSESETPPTTNNEVDVQENNNVQLIEEASRRETYSSDNSAFSISSIFATVMCMLLFLV